MDELKKLYDVLYRERKYTKSFEEFQSKWSQDELYRNKVFEVVYRDGLYTKDKESFFQKYSGGVSAPAPEQEPVTPIVQVQPKKKSEFITELPSVGGGLEQQGSKQAAPPSALKGPQKQIPMASDVPSFVKPVTTEFAEKTVKRIAEEKPLVEEIKKAEDIFDRQLTIKPKVEESAYLKERLSAVNKKLFSREEEYIVPEMEYQFGDLGFRFEESGATGDYMKVFAPNGKTMEISLDNFLDSKSTAEANKLQNFIKENTSSKRLFVLEKTLKEKDKKFNSQQQVDDEVSKINSYVTELNKKQKDFLVKKSQYEAEAAQLQSVPDYQRNTPEYINLSNQLEQKRIALNDEVKLLFAEEESIKNKAQALDAAVGKYSVAKAKQGTWGGGIWNTMLTGVGEIASGIVGIAIDAIVEQPMFGGNDYLKKVLKNNILPDVRTGLVKIVGDSDTTPEWANLQKEKFWAGSLLGLVQSAPAMIAGKGVGGFIQRTAQTFAQINDGLAQEMQNDPDFENITENEKLAISIPIGITSSVLESFGFKNVLKSTGLVNKITMAVLGKAGRGVGAKSFRELVENEVESRIGKGLLITTAAGLAEAETGATQELSETTFKAVYNKIKEKDMFQTPESISDLLENVVVAGAQEAVGGFVLGVPSSVSAAYSQKGFLKMSDEKFQVFENIANDETMQTAFITSLKEKISQGVITEKDAKDELNDYRNAVGLYRQLPEGLTTQQKKEAMNLLKEKRDLEQYVQGKEPAMVTRQKNRINEINETLTKISEQQEVAPAAVVTETPEVAEQRVGRIAELETALAVPDDGTGTVTIGEQPFQRTDLETELQTLKTEQDAIQKQAAGQVPIQPTAGISETLAQGESQAEPQVIAQEGVQEEVVSSKTQPKITRDLVRTLTDEQVASAYAEIPMNLLPMTEGVSNQDALFDAYSKATESGKYPELVKTIEEKIYENLPTERLQAEIGTVQPKTKSIAQQTGLEVPSRPSAKREEIKGSIKRIANAGLLRSAETGKTAITEQEIDAQMELTDAMARVWEETTGNNNFYETFFEDVKEGDIEAIRQKGGALFQDTERPQRPITRVSLGVFELPEFQKMKGNMVAPQSVSDLMKSRGKQIEKDIVNTVLSYDKYKGQKRISFDEFKDDVETQLMKLERIDTNTYASYGMDNLGNSQDYGMAQTVIFNSPIDHGQFGHFRSDFTKGNLAPKTWEIRQIPNTEQYVAIDADMPPGVSQNEMAQYVGTAGPKADVERWIADRNSISDKEINKGLFGHIRNWFNQNTGVYTLAELQSDYFQKNKANDLYSSTVGKEEVDEYVNKNFKSKLNKETTDLIKNEFGIKVYVETKEDGSVRAEARDGDSNLIGSSSITDDVLGFTKEQRSEDKAVVEGLQVLARLNENVAKRRREIIDEYNNKNDEIKKEENKYIAKRIEDIKKSGAGNLMLNQFIASQKVHELRLFREAIKHAADKGATELLFPTPYTIAVIEGYVSDTGNAPYDIIRGSEDGLEPGDEIDYGGTKMIVVESNLFSITVAPKDQVFIYDIDELRQEEINNRMSELRYDLKRQVDNIESITKEEAELYSADEFLSEQVKTSLTEWFENNPEEDVVRWSDIDDKVSEYVSDYYYDMSADDLVGWAGEVYEERDTIYAVESRRSTERLGQPSEYENQVDEDNFKDDLSEDQLTVVNKYDELGKMMMKMRPDTDVFVDNNGKRWLKTSITEADASNPIIAFQEEGGKVKGAIDFSNDNKASVYLFDGADISTLSHEISGHLGRRVLEKLADSNEQFAKDYDAAKKWAGVKDNQWTRSAEEKWARGFEKYLRTGKAPSAKLKNVFESLRTWLTNIYKTIKGSSIDINLTPEIVRVFDNLLVTKSELAPEQTVEPEEEFISIEAKDVKIPAFSKYNASDYVEDEREGENGRSYTYMSSITVEATNADGDTIGSITKIVDEDGTLSFTAEDVEGNEVGRGAIYDTLAEAKAALAAADNKIRKKEFTKEQKAKAKAKEKAAAKAEKEKAKQKAKAEKAAAKAVPAPVPAPTPAAEAEIEAEAVQGALDEMLDLDPAERSTGKKIVDGLDKLIKDIENFEKGTLGVNIALPIMKTILKGIKALVQAGMTLQEAIKKAAKDNNVSVRDVTNGINAISQILPIQAEYDALMAKADALITRQKSRGIDDKKIVSNLDTMIRNSEVYKNANDAQRKIMEREARVKMGVGPRKAASIGRVIGVLKDITNVSRAEKLQIISRIRELSRDVAKDLAAEIRDLAGEGKITANQAANIISKFGKVNMLSEISVSKFVDYMTKVFADAEYASKLSRANSTKKSLSSLSKNKDKNANLRDLAQQFVKIDPSMVEDIDAYNEMASKILESIKGSTIRGQKVSFAEIVNIENATDYINETLKAQQEAMLAERAAEIQSLMGIDVSDFSYDDMMMLLDSKKPISKYNEGIIRDTINRAFKVFSSIIKDAIRTGKDPFTGEDISFTESQKDVVERFMDMDLNILKPKDALEAVDALANFLQNKSTAKMEAVVSKYISLKHAKELSKKGIRSFQLKKYGMPLLGRVLGEQTTNLNVLFERMFKGFNRAGEVMDKMGLTKLINKKALAQKQANNIVNAYVDKFYKLKANGKAFNSAYNNVERGMAAFMMRNVIGTEQEMQSEFERRKNLIEESTDVLSKGNDKEKAKAKLYQEVYDKMSIGDAKNIGDIRSKTDKTNLEAVDFWMNEWANKFEQLSDVAENVYNKVLDKDINYTPDRFYNLSSDTGVIEIGNDDSAFLINGGGNDLYQRETGVLMQAVRPESLPVNEESGKVNRYIDLSFDNNNSNSMYDALVDINTASAIRQIEAFLNSPDFENIFPNSDDAKIIKGDRSRIGRIDLYIRNIRNKNPYSNDELSSVVRKLNKLAAIGVGQALGGVTQPIKQVIPVAINTIINGGGLDISAVFNQDKNAFINNSGYAIASRGLESQAQVESLNKLIDELSETKGEKLMEGIEKLNKWWLDKFLVKPDVFIARAAWLTYYEQSLKKQGIDTKDIDYSTHKLNENAANYAQRMVDRQQNVSDADLAGKFFANRESSNQLLVKTIMPFASFRMNQSSRLGADLATLMNKTSTQEDKKVALRSVAGFAAEMVTFRAISVGISVLLGTLAKSIMGVDEDDEEKEKRIDNIIKGAKTGVFTDVFSPLPIADKLIQKGGAMLTESIEDATELPVAIYSPKTSEFFTNAGLFGIALERAGQLRELSNLSITGKYTDDFGKEKEISPDAQEGLSFLIPAAILSNIGLAPSEVNTVVRYAIKDSKKKTVSQEEKQEKAERKEEREESKQQKLNAFENIKQKETDPEVLNAIDEKIKELNATEEEKKELREENEKKNKAERKLKKSLLTDPDTGEEYDTETEMKRYNKDLWEKNFGEGSDWYKSHKAEDKATELLNKEIRRMEDEEYNYTPKKKGGFGSSKFGTNEKSSKRKSGFGSSKFGAD